MMKKKIIIAILIAAIIISSIALSFTAFASSQELKLNIRATTSMSGVDDMEWFYFTPDQSGIYSFMSFNVHKCEGFLFVKEIDPDTNKKVLKQLDYAGPYVEIESDEAKREEMNLPHYKEFGRNEFQFCLTYHLEAGTTYYFGVSWFLSTQIRQQFDVMLVCDSYDENAITSIEVLALPELNAYTGGEWKKDINGVDYYHYDLSRVISNAVIKVNYSYGGSTTVTGKQEVDGYQISYIDNQYTKHWYCKDDPDYSENSITIRILDKEVTENISVVIGGRYPLFGKVVNMAGEPVENALVNIDGVKAYTKADGSFSVYSAEGYQTISISTDRSIDFNKTIIISASTNDLKQQPFRICNCDVVKDGYINAKDYSSIIKNYSGEDLDKLKEEFQLSINFSKDSYK